MASLDAPSLAGLQVQKPLLKAVQAGNIFPLGPSCCREVWLRGAVEPRPYLLP